MRKDWIESSLEDLSDYEIGGDWGKDPEIGDENFIDIYCIRGSEFRNWQRDKGSTASHRKVKINSFNSRKLLLNDILVEISGGGPDQPVGRTVIIDNEVLSHFKGKNLMFTNFLRLVRPNHLVNSIYINQYLKYFYSTGEIVKYQAGSNNLRNLKFGDFMKIKFPLPPLPEQRAIVKKLESLFSSLDAGVADLKKAQQQLKIYRQAVLKKAFEGELTNIQEKPDVVSFEGEIQIVSGNTPKDLKTAEKIGDLPFYKVSDMNLLGNEIYMSNSNIFLSRTQFHKMKLKTFPKGTIIFPKRGGAILTNKKRILSQDSTFDLNLMGIIPNENFSSKYLYYYFYKMDLAKIADGSAVPQINNKNINPLQIQKYSIDEQKEIVKQIESRLSVCDSIEQNIKESLEKAEALRQSILKKAFEGNLLTAQELAECKLAEDYEPASVLLDRIKVNKKS